MLEMLKMAIDGAKRNHRQVGYLRRGARQLSRDCGTPDQTLVDSISVNPSSVLRTMAVVHEAERSSGPVPMEGCAAAV